MESTKAMTRFWFCSLSSSSTRSATRAAFSTTSRMSVSARSSMDACSSICATFSLDSGSGSLLLSFSSSS